MRVITMTNEERRETISLELIGQNASYDQIAPQMVVHPTSDEAVYHDDFTRALDKYKPVKKAMPQGRYDWQGVAGVILNSEAERLVFFLLMRSYDAGSWQPFIEDFGANWQGLDHYMKGVETGHPLNLAARLNQKEGGFHLPVHAYESKLLIFPSQSLVHFL